MPKKDNDSFLVDRNASKRVSFFGLYGSDPLFRSSVDFAAIGLIVYMFVAPFPALTNWLKPWRSSSVSGPAPAPGSNAVLPNNLKGIVQAATPYASQSGSGRQLQIERNWFKLSDPSSEPALHKAADELQRRDTSAALATLDQIDRPDDPNVASLTGFAYVVIGGKENLQRSFDAFQRAAIAGQPQAMNEVGQFLRLGVLGKIDMSAAVDWYEKGAEKGSAQAATNAGRAYYIGWARPIDYAKAAEYYRKGAEGGDPWGKQNFGAALVNGRGIARDPKAGRAWIAKAAEEGLPESELTLALLAHKGIGGMRDVDQFLKWAQSSADHQFAPAFYELGMFYLEPDDGRPADPTRAAGYLRQAAVKNYSKAQFAYATLCDRGVGISQNSVQAFVYYSLALRGGIGTAQDRLTSLRSRMSAADIETAQKLVLAASARKS